MTTLNKIAYDIAHAMGRETDLALIARIKFKVHQHRAEIIRRDLDRNRFTPQQYVQTIGCVDMEFVDGSSCCGVEVGCKVYRSVKRLPDPVRFKDKVPFYFVGTIDGQKSFSPMSLAELQFYAHSKYNYKLPRYYWDDGYLYLVNSTAKTIQVKGVFEYPHVLAEFSNCDDSKCYSDDDPYPISVDLVKAISQAILHGEMNAERQQEQDDVLIDKK